MAKPEEVGAATRRARGFQGTSRRIGRARLGALLLLPGIALGVACGSNGSSTNQGTPGGDGGPGATGGDSSSPSGDDDQGDATLANDGAITDGEGTGGDVYTPPPFGTQCNGSVKSTVDAGGAPPAAPALTVPSGFTLETLASIGSARQLAALPNGDLLVATNGTTIYIVPNAIGSGPAGTPQVFATVNDSPAQGIAFDGASCTIYVAAHAGLYSAPYVDAQMTANFGTAITAVRTGQIVPGSDGDVHTTSSVGIAGDKVFIGVGSGCNACTEIDPTRAVILQVDKNGKNLSTKGTRIRNAIAMTTNPATGTLWAGGAGQDDLAEGHPFEFLDAVTLHAGTADYGWPDCEENHVAYVADASCANTVAPLIELPPYSTLIGAAFYPVNPTGAHAFPAAYHGGVFIAAHGSWHKGSNNEYVSPPRVAYVKMNGDAPATAVNWSDPTAQWTEFVGGFQLADGVTRVGRATGLAVGVDGTLFIGDDQNGLVYRVRPN
jgi:glucose/arabinose dehydrogenase